MAQKTFEEIEKMISRKANDDQLHAAIIRTKLILKGINIQKVKDDPRDNPLLLQQVRELIEELA